MVEEWDLSFQLLEHTFPMMNGLSKIQIENERQTKRHLGLPKENTEERKEYEHILWPDLEIWNFARKLLLKRKQCLMSKTKTKPHPVYHY